MCFCVISIRFRRFCEELSFKIALSRKKHQISYKLLSSIIGIQTIILCLFLSFILFTSNPFERLNVLPIDGNGLNPLLQDPGLALHPPLLYFGYVGLSVSFSFAVGALITGEINKEWAGPDARVGGVIS